MGGLAIACAELARQICRDHLFCLMAIAAFLAVQLVAAAG